MEAEAPKDIEEMSLDNLLEVLGNTTRRAILAKLAKLPHSASELAGALGITRQAVHSQLNLLAENNIIEAFGQDKRKKYRIRNNLSIRIDITPDYYNINYRFMESDDKSASVQLKDTGCSVAFENIKQPEEKIRFLGENIKNIEQKLLKLENERRALLQNKECFIIELKNILNQQYREKLIESIKERQQKHKDVMESLNLGEEIFMTLFFNPKKYFKRIKVDNLLDDLFYSNMDLIKRAQNRVSIEPLLKDLSRLMGGIFQEKGDDWFFDV